MALALKRTSPVKARILSTLVVAFALVFQPVYGLVASQVAQALSSYSGSVPFTQTEIDANWSKDRSLPTGGYGSVSFAGVNNVLEMRLDKDIANMSGSGFYQTEGLKKQTGATTALKADVYIDADWTTNSKTVRAGIWGTGKDATNSVSAYPIVEFTTDGHVGWRSYDTLTGLWNNSSAPYTLNAWNTLEITLDSSTDVINYLVNGSVIGTAGGNSSTSLAEVILNSKNYGPSAQSYNVRWANLYQGSFVPNPAITNVDAYYRVDPSYTAIGVDFKTKNVTTAADIELRVNRVGGGTYSVFATPSLVASINAAADPTSTSGPIVVAGSRTSTSWTNQTGTWTGSALPESVQVIITLENGDSVISTPVTISTNKATWDQVKPNEAPNITIATPRVNGLVGTKANGNKLKVTGKFTDDERANYMNVFLIKDGVLRAQGIVYGYGTPGSGPNYADVNGNFTLDMDVPAGLETGSYMLRFVGTDHNVYSQHTTVERTIVIDNTAPTGAVSTPVAGTIVGVLNGKLAVSGTVSENLSMNRIGVQLVKRGVSGHVQYIYANNNGLYGTNPTSWTAEFTDLDLEDGAEYGINLYLVDQVGNVTQNPTHWFVIDRTVPTTPVITKPTASQEFPGTVGTPTTIRAEWTESTDASGIDKYQVEYVYTRNGVLTTDYRDVAGNRLYRVQGLSSTVFSDFTIRVRALDKAGNWGAWSDAVTYYYGVSAPNQGGEQGGETGTGGENGGTTNPGSNSGTNNGTGGEPVNTNSSSGDSITPTPQIFTAPFGFTFQPFVNDTSTNQNQQDTTTDNDTDVLGEQDREEGMPLKDTGEVLGLMDHKWFGMAWYWYLVILAGLIGAWLLLAAAIRRRREEEE